MEERTERQIAASLFKGCQRAANQLARFLGSDDELEHLIRDIESD
jgi:hypothetical protein